MSLLALIVAKFPGFGSCAFVERTIDQGPGTILWDVATVVGSGISVSTSGGTQGQISISVTGVYLLICHAESRPDSNNDALIFNWRTGVVLGSIGTGGTNNLSQSGSSYSGIAYAVASLTAPVTLTVNTSAGGFGLEADGCWGFAARLS